MLFLGYTENSKGYWFFNSITKTFTIARNAKFYENGFNFGEC